MPKFSSLQDFEHQHPDLFALRSHDSAKPIFDKIILGSNIAAKEIGFLKALVEGGPFEKDAKLDLMVPVASVNFSAGFSAGFTIDADLCSFVADRAVVTGSFALTQGKAKAIDSAMRAGFIVFMDVTATVVRTSKMGTHAVLSGDVIETYTVERVKGLQLTGNIREFVLKEFSTESKGPLPDYENWESAPAFSLR